MLLFLHRERLHRTNERSLDKDDYVVVVVGARGRLSRMTAPSGERRRAHLLCSRFERSLLDFTTRPSFSLLSYFEHRIPLLDRACNISRRIFINWNYMHIQKPVHDRVSQECSDCWSNVASIDLFTSSATTILDAIFRMFDEFLAFLNLKWFRTRINIKILYFNILRIFT